MRSTLSCHRVFFGAIALIPPGLALASGVGLVCLIGTPVNMLFVMGPIGTLVFLSRKFKSFELLCNQSSV
jgi:hypothetical protein